MERVLHFIPGFNYGGIESRFLDWHKTLNKKKLQFDLLIQTDSNNLLLEEFKNNGGRVYVVPPISPKTIQEHIKTIHHIIKNNDYTAVHCHSLDKSYFVLKIAKKENIKTRILHARTSSFVGSSKIPIRNMLKKISVPNATGFFAVSTEAGKWAFGKNKEIKIIKNAVNTNDFLFNLNKRNFIRKELNIDKEDLVIGHVGRFTYAKNHEFLIDIFNSFRINKNAKLLLIGDGPTKKNIEDKVINLGMKEQVIFEGFQENPEDYYSAMDCFVFPSFYEGLPGSLIEAQLNDLFCLVSNRITKEALVSQNSITLPLEEKDQWVSALNSIDFSRKRNSNLEISKKRGFDLTAVVRELENYYLEN